MIARRLFNLIVTLLISSISGCTSPPGIVSSEKPSAYPSGASNGPMFRYVDKDGVLHSTNVPTLKRPVPNESESAKSQQETSTPYIYDGNPVSINLYSDNLPINYQGDSILNLLNLIKKTIPNKTEFETTDTYLDKCNTSQIFNSIYAFQIIMNKNSDAFTPFNNSLSYDADKSTFIFRLYVERPESYHLNNNVSHAVVIKASKLAERDRIESNAFGVTKEVRSTRFGANALAIKSLADNSSDLRSHQRLGTKDNTIISTVKLHDIDPKDAQSIKDDLRILAICKPRIFGKNPKVVWAYSRYSEARLDHPFRNSSSIDVLNVELLEFWIYNIKTGKIYLKTKATTPGYPL